MSTQIQMYSSQSMPALNMIGPASLAQVYTGSTSSAGPTSSPGIDVTNLSPADLMAYVESQLNELDGVIKEFVASAEAKRARVAAMRDYRCTLEEINATETPTPEDYARWASDLEKKAEAVSDPALKQDMLNKAAELRSDGDIAGTLGSMFEPAVAKGFHEQTGQTIARLKDAIENEGDTTEMEMMKLSQVMQTRSRVIQFASNALAMLDSDAKVPINNMRP